LSAGKESSHGTPDIDYQCFNAVLVSPSAAWAFRRISDWRESVSAAEAKKADDASMATLRTPRPDRLTKPEGLPESTSRPLT